MKQNLPAAELTQLLPGVLQVARLAYGLPVECGHLIRTNDDGIGVPGSCGSGLCFRKPKRQPGRRFAR
jgi:hypothetical protein